MDRLADGSILALAGSYENMYTISKQNKNIYIYIHICMYVCMRIVQLRDRSIEVYYDASIFERDVIVGRIYGCVDEFGRVHGAYTL